MKGFGGGDFNLYAYVRNTPNQYRDPQGTNVAIIENGPTADNPFGHTAVAVSNAGVFSYGNNTPIGTDLSEYIDREASRRETRILVIPTMSAQDAQVLELLRAMNSRMSGNLKDNCSTRSNQF